MICDNVDTDDLERVLWMETTVPLRQDWYSGRIRSSSLIASVGNDGSNDPPISHAITADHLLTRGIS